MHRKTTKSWLRASLAILAACLSGVVFTQAAEMPSQPGDISGVPAKHLNARKSAEKKKQDQKSAKAKQKDQTDSASEIAQLKKQLALQQQQIAQLLQAVNQLQAQGATVSKPAAAAPVTQSPRSVDAASTTQPVNKEGVASVSESRTTPQFPSSGEVASLTPILPATADTKEKLGSSHADDVLAPSAPALGQGENQGDIPNSPLQFHLGAAYITPVGFMDFTSVWRNHDGGSSIGTNFASIPYGNVYQNNLSEFRFSMQNSRVGFRVDAKVHGAHVLGYMEADFLGFSPGNTAVTSNSNSLRSRLYWADVRKGDWEVLGGQTWSLLTPGRTGISPLPGDIFFTQNMDVNYQLGLFWGRIPELRFVYHPSRKVAFAVALDSPEQYVGGSAGGGLITFPSALASTYANELNNGGNTFGVPNVSPDVIAKLALDPSSKFHFEIGGIERNFKLWNPVSKNTFSAAGGGAFANANFELFKGFRLLTNNFWSDGGGRYIFGQAPDLIAKADGSPSLIHASSTVSGFEYTHQDTLLFGYYGGLYVGRNVAIDANGNPVGYGYTGAPAGQNRAVQEGTFGFNQTLWKDAKYGALNFIGQYSYLTRNPWYVATGQPNNAHIHMVFFDLRYTLPGSAPAIK